MKPPSKAKTEPSRAWHQALFTSKGLTTLLESLPQPAIVTDRASARILFGNPAATAFFSAPGKPLVGESTFAFNIWPTPLERSKRLAQLDRDGVLHSIQGTLRDSSGLHHEGSYSMIPIVLDGSPALLSLFNASDKEHPLPSEHAHEQARAHHALEAGKMEAVGHLASTMAHDFNNILAAIMLRLELLALEAPPSQAVEHAVEELGAETKRAAQITRQLLLFSRKESWSNHPMDLVSMLSSSADSLRQWVLPKISLTLDLPGGPLLIDGDESLLSQMLFHLISNARDAMPTGGNVTLRLMELETPLVHPCIPTTSMAAGPHACLLIADQGCGIHESIRPHLFEPFYSTKSVGRGVGLGLASAYGIVQQHKGWITVDSAPGRGTVFSIYIPLLAKPDEQSRAHTGLGNGSAQKACTILLVEDDPFVLRMTSLLLQQQGHRVLETRSGAEAYSVWRRAAGNIGLILADLFLPDGMGGMDLIEEAALSHPKTPAILMSGFNTPSPPSLALPPSCRLLRKPFDAPALQRAIRTALLSSPNETAPATGR